MIETPSFPDNLQRELRDYFTAAIRGTAWVTSEVKPVSLDTDVSGLQWTLRDAQDKSLVVMLDPRRLRVIGPVPNSSNLSDDAWVIAILAQEHVLSHRPSMFRDGEVFLLEHKGRAEEPED